MPTPSRRARALERVKGERGTKQSGQREPSVDSTGLASTKGEGEGGVGCGGKILRLQ